jgi:hypothetical protein
VPPQIGPHEIGPGGIEMEKVRTERGMIVQKVGQGLCGGASANHDWNEQPERAGSANLEAFSAAPVELRSNESVPFQSSNPWTGV